LTLFVTDPISVYQNARGTQLTITFRDLLVEHPFGAGLARWGMAASYFGVFTLDAPALWAEIQFTAWMIDGGILLIALYCGALVVTALGPILRRTMLDAVVRASDGLLRAASSYLALKGTRGADSCPECGSHDTLRIGSPALDALSDLGLRELDVCRQCGFTRGRVEHPDAIRVDDARGVRPRAVEPELESSAEPDAEHPG